jgi:predicted membrane-bound mannosyltransferase
MRRTVSSDSPAVMLDSLLPYVTVALPVTLLCVWNLDFPLGYHGDEVKKVGFVKSGTADFHHPLLLLQLTGLTSRGLGSKTDTEIVLAGRIVSVISAAGTALWTLWHGRRLLPKCWAWWSACTASVTPLVVMHAHYMKEDMLLTFLSLLALRPLSQLARRCQFPYAILFGIFAGLASSSHYKGCLLFIVASVLPLCARFRTSPAIGAVFCAPHMSRLPRSPPYTIRLLTASIR